MSNSISTEKEISKTMRFEFKINIKHVNHRSKHCYMAKVTKEPGIRRNLILAHQLKELMEKDKAITINKISGWLGLTYRRILQIMDILYLAPKIQEEILFSEQIVIYRISDRKIYKLTKEVLWENQAKIWHELLAKL